MSTHQKPTNIKVGGTVPVPFRLHSAVLTVDCVVVETRQVYGRTEWLVVPVQGHGQAWVRDDSLDPLKGVPA